MTKPKTLLTIVLVLLYNSCIEETPEIKFPDDLKLGTTVNSGCLKKSTASIDNDYFTYSLGDDYIEISHLSVQYHCAAELDFEMEITEDDKIILKEVDNAEFHANCLCSYNLSTTIENIVKGLTYEIEVWNEDMSELLYSKTILF